MYDLEPTILEPAFYIGFMEQINTFDKCIRQVDTPYSLWVQVVFNLVVSLLVDSLVTSSFCN